MAQSVKHPVVISRFMSWSPTLGTVLIAQSLEPVLNFVSPSLCLPLPACAMSLCLSKINVKKKVTLTFRIQ